MDGKNQLYATLATFAIALGIGFVMQYHGAGASNSGGQSGASELQKVLNALDVNADDNSVPQRAAPASADALLGAPVPLVIPPMRSELPPDIVCGVSLAAAPQFNGMVELSVRAPCKRETDLTVYHEGMMFAGQTDEDGSYKGLVPALAGPDASFVVSFRDGEGGMTRARMPVVGDMCRTVLQWSGPDGLQLHVNAPESEDGAIPKVSRLAVGNHRLGAMAEVVSYGHTDPVTVTVEAEVTSENCGKDLEGTLFQINPGVDPVVLELGVTMPPCEAIGDFVVLQTVDKGQIVSLE